MVLDVFGNCLFERLHAAEGSAADTLAGNLREESLHLIEPTGAGGRLLR
jgi:hypothetical protein